MKKVAHSAGGIIVNSLGQVVFANQCGCNWSLPKGGIEKGEGELECAVRKIGAN